MSWRPVTSGAPSQTTSWARCCDDEAGEEGEEGGEGGEEGFVPLLLLLLPASWFSPPLFPSPCSPPPPSPPPPPAPRLIAEITAAAVAALVMSPWIWKIPSTGAMGCRSTATMQGRGGRPVSSSSASPSSASPSLSSLVFPPLSFVLSLLLSSLAASRAAKAGKYSLRERTWDQEPGAAQRSTALRTPLNVFYLFFICFSR